ncbi:MAG: class I SAM-dependent methyltransferase [Candidatus Acidiferrales bacterium]
MITKVHYGRYPELVPDFRKSVEQFVVKGSLKRICEVGSGGHPAISAQFIKDFDVCYSAIDRDRDELEKGGVSGARYVMDICEKPGRIPGSPYDLICSVATMEHVKNPRLAHENILKSLAPTGLAVHLFPTLYCLPYLLNLLLPEFVSDVLLSAFAPRNDDGKSGKLPAYYRRCRGPVGGQIKFFQNIGYDVLEFRGYFGHGYYEARLPWLHVLEEMKTDTLLAFPIAHLTSFATVILQARPVAP